MAEDVQRPRRILLVEDNSLDARSALRAFTKLRSLHHVDHVASGASTLAVLADGAEADSLPDLVILDLNLPGIGGLEILRAISSDPRLEHLPVVVLTTSDHGTDIEGALTSGATDYLLKPYGLDEWSSVLNRIDALLAGT